MSTGAHDLRGRELSHFTAFSTQLLGGLIVEEALDVPILNDFSLGCGLVKEDSLHNIVERGNVAVDGKDILAGLERFSTLLLSPFE